MSDFNFASQFFHRAVQGWADADADMIVSAFAPDGVFHNMPMEPVKGVDALRENISAMVQAVGAVEFEILDSYTVGDTLINQRVDSMNFSGRTLRLPVAGFITATEQGITLWRDYFDATAFSA